jgi:hypothetical protein
MNINSRECEIPMCSQCDEIDVKIERLQNLARRVFDQQTLDGIEKLIAELQAQKTRLHPE